MLLPKPMVAGDVVSIRLVTGEELLARLVSSNNEGITITKPMMVTIGVDERSGRPGVQMSPFFMLCTNHDTPLTFKFLHILVYTVPSDAALNGYIQNTSGLTVSSKTPGLIL